MNLGHDAVPHLCDLTGRAGDAIGILAGPVENALGLGLRGLHQGLGRLLDNPDLGLGLGVAIQEKGPHPVVRLGQNHADRIGGGPGFLVGRPGRDFRPGITIGPGANRLPDPLGRLARLSRLARLAEIDVL
jgi:hypothetical protein